MVEMRFNPFEPNKIVTPNAFVGRADEVSTIVHAFFQARHSNPQHFLIEGERGIGKSSLALMASLVAGGTLPAPDGNAFNFLVLEVDLSGADDQIAIVRSIARELKSQLAQREELKERARKVWDFLTSWEVAGVRMHKEAHVFDADEARDTLISQMSEICIDGRCGVDGILILIDEADAPPSEAGLGEFLKIFTERLTKRGCNNVLVGLAGLPSTIATLRASHESAPRLFSILSLKPLEIDERRTIVLKGLDKANSKNAVSLSIEDDALDLLADMSEGYPHFVQQFAYSAFEADHDNVITLDDVLQGAYEENGAIAQLGAKYFDEMYNSKINSDEYRKVLQAMASRGDAWVSKAEIRAVAGVKETTLTNAMAALKARKIILSDETRQGFYRLPTRSFAAWINAVASVGDKLGGEPIPLSE